MYNVAPFVGAWIEIKRKIATSADGAVAPFVGAWIEIRKIWRLCNIPHVAPFVGAWIEICPRVAWLILAPSLRSSERGLKFLSILTVLYFCLSLRSSERGLK